MRSSNLRDARRAGEKTTPATRDSGEGHRGWRKRRRGAHSQPMVSARQATKMAMLRSQNPVLVWAGGRAPTQGGGAHENVFPKRRGVEMSTSPGVVFQPCAFMILGRCVPHESR